MPLATLDPARLRAALEKATAELLAQRNAQGFWAGELSSSALATATAVTALAVALKHGGNPQSPIPNSQSSISAGLKWLAANQNADGGWGDTTKSLSNISTTTLGWAAFGAAGADAEFSEAAGQAARWLRDHIRPHLTPALSPPSGSGEGEAAARPDSPSSVLPIARSALAAAIIARYGKDRTFSVPILTMCALAGRLGEGRAAWEHVIPLPFELAACPHQLFAALRLPVVSYALPALIAIGQARHVHAPSRNPFARLVRMATRGMTLRKLAKIQPSNGGFLEATPLTSFVTMSLAASGQANHVVTQRGLEFLLKSQRLDGSWPIDTNLSTWCTTLAIDALPTTALAKDPSTIEWLLKQQHRAGHPYTHAAPGGWAWTDLPGGVPDADDTAGALLALAKLPETDSQAEKIDGLRIVEAGLRWLLGLQNRDGGIPTFCRGWGALPFDRSSPDITAHTIRAWLIWAGSFPHLEARLTVAIPKALVYLESTQRPDGSLIPLWFGNQHARSEENPLYGTARALKMLAAVIKFGRGTVLTEEATPMTERAAHWLISAQNTAGGWSGFNGGPASVEETALATEALARFAAVTENWKAERAAALGAHWLIERVESGAWHEPSPIGFYFAKLWYFERLYPMIFTVGALRAMAEMLDEKEKSGGQ